MWLCGNYKENFYLSSTFLSVKKYVYGKNRGCTNILENIFKNLKKVTCKIDKNKMSKSNILRCIFFPLHLLKCILLYKLSPFRFYGTALDWEAGQVSFLSISYTEEQWLFCVMLQLASYTGTVAKKIHFMFL